MSLRILHILDHSVPLQSGYAFRTLAILHEQRKRGWQTFQITSTKHYGAMADVEDVDGFTFYRARVKQNRIRALPVVNQAAVILDTRRRLEQVIEVTRPDVLHAHSPCLNGIAARGASVRRRLPLVYEMRASWEDAAVDHGSTRHGSLRYSVSRNLETWVLKRADAVTTISEGLRKDILSRGVASERVTVIPNGVDIERFTVTEEVDSAVATRFGLEGRFVIGFVGSFYGYEGLDLLIQAMPLILESEPATRLLLVGGGPEEQSLRQLASRLGISDKVIMVGRVPHSDVAKYYSVIDVLAFPRKSNRLTEMVTPLKPLEAMAQGKLVVASNVGGHREMIEDGQTGFLFPADDATELAASIRKVLAARHQWPEVQGQARRFVERERTWRSSVARYEWVYRNAIEAAASR